jgi:hypothetical protein
LEDLFVNSLVFGKNTITYLTQNILNLFVLQQNENIITEIDYNKYIEILNNI